MRELLNDAVGLVTECGDDGGDKIAMMSRAVLVDLDPRMFAIFEERCNATVRTPLWAKAADQASSQLGRVRDSTRVLVVR